MDKYQRFWDLLESLSEEQQDKMYNIMKLIIESASEKEEGS